jgi:hypothetical protein
MVAVPEPAVKSRPFGSLPFSEMDGTGEPVALIVKLPDCRAVKVAWLGLTMVGLPMAP